MPSAAGQDEIKLVSFVEERYGNAQMHRVRRDEILMENIAEYQGKPQFLWDSISSRLRARKGPQSESDYPNINWNVNTINHLCMQVNGGSLAHKIIPHTAEPEDIDAAAIADMVLRRNMLHLRWEGKLKWDLAFIMFIMGDAFLKQWWEPLSGIDISWEGRRIMLGDVKSCIRSPLAMSIDPMAVSMDDARWVMEHTVRDVVEVREMFPHSAGDLGSEGLDNTMTHQARLKNLTDGRYANYLQNRELCVLKEYWEKPSIAFPEGRVITVCAGRLMDYKENAEGKPWNPYGLYPYTHFGAIPVPETMYHRSPLEITKFSARGYNQGLHDVRVWHRRARPKVIGGPGTLYGKDKMTDQDFELIEVDARKGVIPHFQPTPPLPPDVWRHMEIYRRDYNEQAGIHQASQGAQDSNVRSQSHFASLVEQDARKFGPIAARYAASWEEACLKNLKIEQRFSPVMRLEQIVGSYRAAKIDAFLECRLGENVDVQIMKDSVLPKSFPLRLATAEKFYQMGYYGAPGSREARIEMDFHFMNDSAYLNPSEHMSKAVDTAQSENAMMENGKMAPPPGDWEPDDIHLTVHENRMNMPDFKFVEERIQKIYMVHRQEHKMQLAQKMQQKMQQMEQVQQLKDAGAQKKKDKKAALGQSPPGRGGAKGRRGGSPRPGLP